MISTEMTRPSLPDGNTVPLPLRRVPVGYGLDRLVAPKVESADESVLEEQRASATPFDVDEAAGFLGRLKFLGKWAGRAVMAGGTYMAFVAAHEAIESVEKDFALWNRARNTRLGLEPEHADADKHRFVENMKARQTLISEGEKVPKKLTALATNAALLVGSLGMGVNLIFADLMLGGIFPVLGPIAETGMLFGVWGMAVWGSSLALQAISSTLQALRQAARHRHVPPTPEIESVHTQANLVLGKRARKIPGRDLAAGAFAIGLGASALALQYLAAPLALVPLVVSTLGLVFARVRRDALRDLTVARWREQADDLPQTTGGLENALVRLNRQHEACVHLRETRFGNLPLGLGTWVVSPLAKLWKRWSVEPWERPALATERQRGLALVNAFYGIRTLPAGAERRVDPQACRQDLEWLCAVLYELSVMPDFAQAAAADRRLIATPAKDATWYRFARAGKEGLAPDLLPSTPEFSFDTETYLDAVENLSPEACARITEHLFEHGVRALQNRGANVTSERMAYVSEILLARRRSESNAGAPTAAEASA